MMNGSRESTNVVAVSEVTKGGKRRWSIEEKTRIAEASLKPGACFKAVAQANGAHPSQLYKWRRLYRSGLLSQDKPPALLPVRIAETTAEPLRYVSKDVSATWRGTIRIEFASVRVFIDGQADAATLRTVLEHLGG